MRVKFTKQFIKMVKARPQDWRNPDFILAQGEKPFADEDISIRINGKVYDKESWEFSN